MRLTPLKADNGWVISVGPRGSDEDWTYPVTFPLRTGEQQVMGTGYGSTVQEKLAHPITVEFVLTHPDFVKYSEMAQSALDSSRPEAAGEYIKRISGLRKGEMTVVATSYEKGDTAETVKDMTFQATILVPKSFEAARCFLDISSVPRFLEVASEAKFRLPRPSPEKAISETCATTLTNDPFIAKGTSAPCSTYAQAMKTGQGSGSQTYPLWDAKSRTGKWR